MEKCNSNFRCEVRNVDKLTQQQEFISGIKACVPTLLGYLSIGFAAGIIEKKPLV